jgi:FkbM family methyltransferase
MKFKTIIFNQLRKLLRIKILDSRLSSLIIKYPNSMFLRKIIPGNRLYSKGSERTENRNGVNFLLDLSDYPDWSLYFYSEIDSSKNVLSFVNSGDTILDIGGNIGQTALMMAKKVGQTGRVISFEPYPNTILKFEKNLSLNKTIKNLTLIKFGLSDEEAVVKMYQDCLTNSAGNRISHNLDEGDAGIKEVTIKVLDDFLQEKENLIQINLIKIDVEGYEMNVLKGAKKTLLKYKPNLFVEIDNENLRKQGSNPTEVMTFLIDLGYEIIDLSTMQKISGIDKIEFHTDIFCRPKID